MKKGIFVIIEKEGRKIAGIKRADGQIVELEVQVTPELQKLNGQKCEYLLKGDKIVRVGGKNIFQKIKQEAKKHPEKPPTERKDWRREMNKPEPIEPEIIDNIQMPGWSKNDSFQLNKARVPFDTRRVQMSHRTIDNFSLKLNQFARFEESYNERRDEWNRKFVFLRGKGFQIQTNFGKLYQGNSQPHKRQFNAIKSLFNESDNLIVQAFRPNWRFITGLGGHSVYETGITLHHIYGIPYIPASSIKGVLRSWIILTKFDNNEGVAIGDEAFCQVFGCPAEITVERNRKKKKYKSYYKEARGGKVTFFDALPTHKPTIEPDVMNVHYPKWYNGRGAPVDSDRPNPVFFLTVKDTPFQFLIGSKEWNISTQKFWGKKLGEWLAEALAEHGIGAKTAVGYGYMKPV